MKKSKRFGCLFLCMVLLICSTCVVTSASASTPTYEQNVKDSNDMVFNFWDAFTDYETETYAPPEYFGGFSLDSNGKLIVYLTDNRQEIREAVADICGSNDMTYESVEYSFNQLYALQNQMSVNAATYHIVSSQLNLPENKLIVYTDASAALLSMTLNGPMGRGIQNDMIEVRTCPTTMVAHEKQNMNVNCGIVPTTVSATTFYPGLQSDICNSSGILSGTSGTIGVCATDSGGRRLLITHGHNQGEYVKVNGVVCPVQMISSTVNDIIDAACVVLPDTAILSNKVNNITSKKLTTVALESQLSSYSGAAVEAYGIVNGFITGTATVIKEGGIYYMNMENMMIAYGDSGGPIYLTGNSKNCLLGIIRGAYPGSSTGIGIVWQNIKNHYYSKFGYVLAPFVPNV